MGLNGRLTIQTRLDEINSLSLVRLMKVEIWLSLDSTTRRQRDCR